MQVFNTVVQFLFVLTILVGLHEFGHFIAARMFKIRVDKFYIFFDFMFPLPNVLNFALFKKKIGDTEYGLGWFPLGGYVSIAGMVDETQDASKLASTPEPHEFRSKPAWQRLIVMLGGIIVNVILGIFIYSTLTFLYGDPYVSKDEANKTGIAVGEFGKKMGFQNGDKILKINGKDFTRFDEIRKPDVILGDKTSYTVERGGQPVEVVLPESFLNELSEGTNKETFISLPMKFTIGEIQVDMPADKAGIEKGDQILKINETPITYFHELRDALEANKNKDVTVVYKRGTEEKTANVKITNDARLGFAPTAIETHKTDIIKYGLLASIARGSEKAFDVVVTNIKGFGKIFSGKVDASKALSGPVGMAKNLFPPGLAWDWIHIWEVTALLSMALAFMNILPIPALDGGHAVTLIWEMITGKPLSIKAQETLQTIGTFLILALTVYVFYIDIFLKK
jgi:regulator of sigma E protease